MRTRTHRGRTASAERRITARRLVPCHGVTSARIIRAVRTALGDRPCRNLTVVVVDDAQIARLHKQFMADPSSTDVLTFDLRDDLANGPIDAEIVLSAETAERQARRYRTEPGRELLRYAIHGTLHLVGFDDHSPDERKRMQKEEHRILATMIDKGPGAGKRIRPGQAQSRNARRIADRV
ncbi:MAG: rRNA maturation RNase YbeY [Phycisphaerae bacterium]|nr:rRNA maturation RNase YbeY [Phycisphaerae bacterium]